MEKLRVIQWNTGKVGKHAARAILDDPRLELVGAYAFSPDKVGKDVGALCGRPDCGVLASDDIDALIAAGADTVLYTPFMADLGHAIRLLENGMDVISTNLFLNVGGIRGAVKDQLEAACQRGNSSLYITGINPGWVNSVAASLTAICREVSFVGITESADCSVYESVETWTAMGMGMPAATPEVLESAQNWLILFKDAAERVGDALGLTFDDMEFFIDFATAAEKIDLGWFCMEKGTNAACKAGWKGKIGGETVVQITIVWYLTKKLAEGWAIDDDQYHLVVRGEPGIDARIRMTPGEHWTNHDWDIMTALPAINAVFDIKAARAGVLGLRDVGLPLAPVGVWRGK
jgi:hypothetical protein